MTTATTGWAPMLGAMRVVEDVLGPGTLIGFAPVCRPGEVIAGVVLAHTEGDTDCGKYVTWVYSGQDESVFWGHYFNYGVNKTAAVAYAEAVQDFALRALTHNYIKHEDEQ